RVGVRVRDTARPAAAGSRAEVGAALAAAPPDVVILIASRLEPWKGHLDLIRALAGLTSLPWSLWIAGGAQGPHEHEYAAALQAEVRRHDLEARVHFLGERRDVGRLLAGAD